jgi:hypothetical protein
LNWNLEEGGEERRGVDWTWTYATACGISFPGKTVSQTVIRITKPALGTGAAPMEPKVEPMATLSQETAFIWERFEWAKKLIAQGNPTADPSILTLAPIGRTIFAIDSETNPVSTTVWIVIGSVAAWEWNQMWWRGREGEREKKERTGKRMIAYTWWGWEGNHESFTTGIHPKVGILTSKEKEYDW